MKIALAQINSKVGDLKGNTSKIFEYIDRAAKENNDIVIFPELTITGYPPRDLLDFTSFVEDNLIQLEEIVKYTENLDIAVICGYVDFCKKQKGRKYSNSAAFIYKGKIISIHNKSLLPFYDVFDETRYFEPGETFEIIEFKGKRLGLTICEEIWNDSEDAERALYERNPVAELAKQNVNAILNISASPYDLNKLKQRESIITSIASRYKIPIVYVNQIGGNDDLLFDGSSFAVDGEGNIKARCSDFAEDMGCYNLDTNSGIVKEISKSKEESLFKALCTGLKDYCGKMGFKKVLLGLSGGIDSALTAAIACAALGPENVLGITLPSMYSSKGSVDDSKKLAENLGMKCLEIPIKNIFDCFIENVQPEQGVLMDLAEENLQARIRANILMLYSNRYGYLLLSTGNKSEMSVGYCTLYGDMAGGLNLLSDVPKTMVYKLSRYINTEREIIPEAILTKAPSAELRPNQKDQDSLPSYEVLDDIMTDYVEKNVDPAKIAEKYPKHVVADVINKINKSEYKRRQATLGLKISNRAYGSGRRFPIVQGYDFRIK